MSNAITLTPNMLHCVRTGRMVAKLPDHLDRLNEAIASGMLEAGMHTGHLRCSDATIETLKDKGVSLKRYFWGKPQSNTTARRIAAHNEATLQQHGFSADPSTKTKGQLSKRQYGVYAAPQPKVVEALVPPVFCDFLEEPETATLPVEPTVPSIVMPNPPANVMPNTTELSVKGGFMKYRSRASKAGMSMQAVQNAWATARDAYKQNTQPKVVEPCDTGCEVCDEPVAKPQPKVVQPSPNAGNTIRVNADALAATLSALTDARIVSNEGAVFTVQYGA